MSDAAQTIAADFEKAARNSYRYSSPTIGGQLSTEDLWKLTKLQLNDVAVSLDDIAEKGAKKTFLAKKSTVASDLAASKLAVVLHVLRTKEAEDEAASKAADKRRRRAELLEMLDQKNKEADQKKTPEEILAELEALDKE